MRVSRATFLKALATAMLGSRVDARALFAVAQAPPAVPSESAGPIGRFRVQDAEPRHFRAHLKTSFAVRSPEGTRVGMVLAEVSERPVTRDVEQFSLIFHAPAGTTVPNGIHAFQHAVLGDFDLFIVPIGMATGQCTVYQACFSSYSTRRRT